MSVTAFERVVDALRCNGATVKDTANGVQATCPAHADNSPSLSVTRIDGQALLCCHAGCATEDVVAAVGLTMRDLFDNPRGATYSYPDGRTVHRTPDKRFRQSGNTKGNSLFHGDRIGDAMLVHVVEGEKDVLAIESAGGVAVCSAMGAGKAHKADWSPLKGLHVTIVADRDEPGRTHAQQVAALLRDIAESVKIVEAAAGKDAADHITSGFGLTEFVPVEQIAAPETVATQPISLNDAHRVFRRWLGDDYDTDALDAVLAAAAVEQLDGDPLWLLLISGSGNAKTETVQSLDGIGAIVTSTIASCGALLSATAKKERAKDATGGLLRKLEPRGVLVIKDVTSILSMSGENRAEVLAALREVYDGRWARNVGTDGGRTLEWAGRVAVVGAVTTAWDKAHAVIASMGDRFVLIRMDSTTGRRAAGLKAISNTGSETTMRAELASAAAGVLAGVSTQGVTVTEQETDVLLKAADLVTLARTGVEYDYRGDVIDAHAPEMPTRFAKQLAQVVRGGVAIGMDRGAALRLAIRCARDSMPPLRLAIIDDVAAWPDSSTADIRKRIGKPRATVDRQLQALHMLDVLDCDEQEVTFAGKETTRWRYRLAEGIEPTDLDPTTVRDFAVPTPIPLVREEAAGLNGNTLHTHTAKSGTVKAHPEPPPLRRADHTIRAHQTHASSVGHPECVVCGRPVVAGQGDRHLSCATNERDTNTMDMTAETRKERERAEQDRQGRSDLFTGIAKALSTLELYGGTRDIPALMAGYNPDELAPPMLDRYMEISSLNSALNFVTALIEWRKTYAR